MANKKVMTELGINVAENTRKKLLLHYKDEEKVSRSVSPLYEPYFGKVMQISINGITIAFPIDGTTHQIPQTFADALDSRVMAIDAIIKKSKKMAKIPENYERNPGELKMF